MEFGGDSRGGAGTGAERCPVAAATAALVAALDALHAVELAELSDARLVDALDAVERQARRLPSVRDALVAQVQRRDVATAQGFRSTSAWLRSRFLIGGGEVRAWLRGAERMTPSISLTGEPIEPVLPIVVAARAAGDLSPAHVKVIDDLDEELPTDLHPDRRREIEHGMVECAKQFDPNKLTRIGQRLLDAVDPDGTEPAADDAHRRRGITIGPLRRGLARISGHVDAWTRDAILAVLASFADPDPVPPASAEESASGDDSDGSAAEARGAAAARSAVGQTVDGDEGSAEPAAGFDDTGDARADGECASACDPDAAADLEASTGGPIAPLGSIGLQRWTTPDWSPAAADLEASTGGPIAPLGGIGPQRWTTPDWSPDEQSEDPWNGNPKHGPDPSAGGACGTRLTPAESPPAGTARGTRLTPPVAPLVVPAGQRPLDADRRTHPQRLHDALSQALQRLLREGRLPRRGGTAATILLTVPLSVLEQRTGLVSTGNGGDLPISEVIRRATDATLIPIVIDRVGNPLYLGRQYRLASPQQRHALHIRDGGCVIPGCTTPSQDCQAHHIVDWAEGGRTDIDNLCLLCEFHHHRIRPWTLELRDGRIWCTPPSWVNRDQSPEVNVYFRHTALEALFA